MKVPITKQVPGPIGQTGERGSQGKQGAKGANGMTIDAPVQPFSELDRTIALFDIGEKINRYLRD